MPWRWNDAHSAYDSSDINPGKLYLLVKLSRLGDVLVCPKVFASLGVYVLLFLDNSSNTLQSSMQDTGQPKQGTVTS